MLTKKIRDKDKAAYTLADDVTGRRILFVNHYMIGQPGPDNPWVLIDAGLPGSAKRIQKEAEELFGPHNPPRAILLTHGHFDHTGALPDLLKIWPETDVYAHPLEIPYITGRATYPESAFDESGASFSFMTWIIPVRPIDLGSRVYALPVDGSIPFLPEWKYIHTPGHSPGHISLYREKDNILITGDAFTTTNQDALSSVFIKKKEMHGPPAFLTTNWREAYSSIKKLAALNPEAAGTGHGIPLRGEELRKQLSGLIESFFEKEIPYKVRFPHNETKSYNQCNTRNLLIGLSGIAAITAAFWLLSGNKDKKRGKQSWFA